MVINGSDFAKRAPKMVFKLVQSIEKKAKRPGKTHSFIREDLEKTDFIREGNEVKCT